MFGIWDQLKKLSVGWLLLLISVLFFQKDQLLPSHYFIWLSYGWMGWVMLDLQLKKRGRSTHREGVSRILALVVFAAVLLAKMPMLYVLVWLSSFVLTGVGLHLALRSPSLEPNPLIGYLYFLVRLGGLPCLGAVLPFLILAVLEPEHCSFTYVFLSLLHVFLALVIITPLAYRPPKWHQRTRLEIGTIIISAAILWWGLGESRVGAFHVPMQIAFFPLVILAAVRAGLAGVSILVCVLVFILPSAFPDHANQVFPEYPFLKDFFLSSIQLLFIVSGQLLAVLVEHNRHKEKELKDMFAHFASLINQSPNLMTLKDLDGRYLMANQPFLLLVGGEGTQVRGKTVHQVMPHANAEVIRLKDREVLRKRQPVQLEQRFRLYGEDKIFLSTIFPLFDHLGDISGIGSIAADITERRKEELQREEDMDKYRAVVEQSLVGIYIQQDEKVVYVNPTLALMAGYDPNEVLERDLAEVLDPDEVPRIRQQIQRRFEDKQLIMHYTTRLRHKTGSVVDVEIHSRLIEYQGRPAIIGVVINISDRVAANAELKLAAKVFENSAEGILITDAAGKIITVNDAFTRITGFSRKEAIGKVSRMLRDSALHQPHIFRDLKAKGHWHGDVLDRRKGGEWYPAELTISAVLSPHGVLVNYVGVFSDITVRKQAEERLQFLANHDTLTHLPNRTYLTSHLEQALIKARIGHEKLAVLFIDLDRFKLINDSFGHQAGDELLGEISRRLIEVAKPYGLVARLGGDEFTLVVSHYQASNFLDALANDLLAVLARPIYIENYEIYVTGSIGISLFPSDGDDVKTLLKHADVAMYRAKELGKNNYQFFDPMLNERALERLTLENSLRLAIERHEFELYYQPQIKAKTGKLAGVEALLRWHHPQMGMVPPAKFIPLAEETGQIKAIGAWVIQEACQQLAKWDKMGLVIPRVAVNLSTRQFEQPSLVQQVKTAIGEAGISPSRLDLEITESMLMQDPESAIVLLGELKKLGVKLSIDDFGTGYSSLSILKRFPLDYLKVDRSFVDGLPFDEDSAAITQAIIAMARKLKFTVIAEGVETTQQHQFLRDNGCELLQGYFFSKPIAASAIGEFIHKNKDFHAEQADSVEC